MIASSSMKLIRAVRRPCTGPTKTAPRPTAGVALTAGRALLVTLAGCAATPVISPATGSYTCPVQVQITDSTAGSSIFYTTNNTTATTSSTPYTGPFSIGTTSTVQAIATVPATAASASTLATPAAITCIPAAAANYKTGCPAGFGNACIIQTPGATTTVGVTGSVPGYYVPSSAAVSFTPATTTGVTGVKVVFALVTGFTGQDSFNVSIVAQGSTPGPSGSVMVQQQGVSFSNTFGLPQGSGPVPTTITWPSVTTLQGGTVYWLVIQPASPATAAGAWYLSPTDTATTTNYMTTTGPGSPWVIGYGQRPEFEVD